MKKDEKCFVAGDHTLSRNCSQAREDAEHDDSFFISRRCLADSRLFTFNYIKSEWKSAFGVIENQYCLRRITSSSARESEGSEYKLDK